MLGEGCVIAPVLTGPAIEDAREASVTTLYGIALMVGQSERWHQHHLGAH